VYLFSIFVFTRYAVDLTYHHQHCSPWWALASFTPLLQPTLSSPLPLQPLTPITTRSVTTLSNHLLRGRPFLLLENNLPFFPGCSMVLTFQVPITQSLPHVFCRGRNPTFPLSIRGGCVGFVTVYFLRRGVLSPTPNPQPGGPGYPFLSGSSPLTCLAWETLPVATLPPA
jgi:hypothetical protein